MNFNKLYIMQSLRSKLAFMPLLAAVFVLFSCTKEIPKELLEKQGSQTKQETNVQNVPDDSIHRNISKDPHGSGDIGSDGANDPKAEQMIKDADDAEAQYKKTNSETDKKNCINKQLSAANYLMFEAALSPKKKYKPALQRYRRVLELDPKNTEAAENRKQLEDIYESMGMPVPN